MKINKGWSKKGKWHIIIACLEHNEIYQVMLGSYKITLPIIF